MTSQGPWELDRGGLGRGVDAAIGPGYDRAFALLDGLDTAARRGCICQRCRTTTTMLHLVLRRELHRLEALPDTQPGSDEG